MSLLCGILQRLHKPKHDRRVIIMGRQPSTAAVLSLQQKTILVVVTLLLALSFRAHAFLPIHSPRLPHPALSGLTMRPHLPSLHPTYRSSRIMPTIHMGLTEMVNDTVVLVTPALKGFVEQYKISPFVIKWFHGISMSIVLATMVTVGTYLGFKIRSGEGAFLFNGKTARELHPVLMGAATIIFFIGGWGGVGSMAIQGKPLLESWHSLVTAVCCFLLLGQVALSKFLANNMARALHTYLGSATVALLFYSAYLGIGLGLKL